MSQLSKQPYTIENTGHNDLAFVYGLFEQAIEYQKRNRFNVWNGYDKEALQSEMHRGLQFKVMQENQVLAVFSVCFSDPVIWRSREKGDALYLHRIVVNPDFKGQRHFEKILHWAKAQARSKRLSFVRMDTWADNQKILDYYLSFGFHLVENYTTPDSEALSFPYRNLRLGLLEIAL